MWKIKDKYKIDIYRHAYQDSAAVKTTLVQRMYNKGSSKLFDGDTELDDVIVVTVIPVVLTYLDS